MADDMDIKVTVIKEEIVTTEKEAPSAAVQVKQELQDEDCVFDELPQFLENDIVFVKEENHATKQQEHLGYKCTSSTMADSKGGMIEVSIFKIEEDTEWDERLFSAVVMLEDCQTELEQSGRYCQDCTVLFSSHSALSKHLESSKVHNNQNKTFQCNLCQHRFVSQYALKIHKGTHAKEKPFKCNFCDYRCIQRSKLDDHIRTHTKEKPFKCNLCEYRCTQRIHLRTHNINKHTKERPFKCHLCDYRCSEKGSLKKHIRIHNKIKPFKCNVCDYSCNESTLLKEHTMRRHTQEKPLQCNSCEYRCALKVDMMKHVRTHTQKKTIKCELCDYRCHQTSLLKSHRKHKHSEDAPFKCDICEYKCISNNALKKHKRSHVVP